LWYSEVAFDPFGLFLDAAQGADGGTRQGDLFWPEPLGHPLLQVGVEQLVRVQLRRVAGQIEDLDLVSHFP
jgi:hypothetical protein